MSSEGYHSLADEMEENARRRAEFERRKKEGKGIIPYGNPRERLLDDRKKRLAQSPSPVPSAIGANLKKGVRPKPISKSPILQQSRDADYFLDSIRARLEDLHNDFVDMQKQFDSRFQKIEERLDDLFRLQRKRRLK